MPKPSEPLPPEYVEIIRSRRETERDLYAKYRISGEVRRAIVATGAITRTTLIKANVYFRDVGLPPLEWHDLWRRKDHPTRAALAPATAAAHSQAQINAQAIDTRSSLVPSASDHPAAGIRHIFTEGTRLHYELFRPDAAMDLLQQLPFHPSLRDVPPAEAFTMLAATMAIYRQSIGSGEGHFRTCGRACLEILARLTPRDRNEHLAAAICTAAWELIAVTVQRGGSMEAIPLLDRVNDILTSRELWPYLPSGRGRSIHRLMHWARVIAYQKFQDVDAYLQRHDSPINVYAERAKVEIEANSKEKHNIILQQMAEHFRFAVAKETVKYTESAASYFESKIYPVLIDLSDSSTSVFGRKNDVPALHGLFTPSTAMEMAFTPFVFALTQPNGRQAREIADRAIVLAKEIHRASASAITVPIINEQLRKVLTSAKLQRRVSPEILDLFSFVSPISPGGRVKLHRVAVELLDNVTNSSSVSVRT